MTKLTLAQLNEKITETVEARPESKPKPRMKSPKGFWRTEYIGQGRWAWVPMDFTSDVGAIMGLIREKELAVEIDLPPRAFCVAAYNANTPSDQSWTFSGDAEPPRRYWQEWSGGKNDDIAPALCCALWFALTGERVEIQGD